MGNRRFSRKRLYEIEKAGQQVELNSGAGISACVGTATQHRQGQEIITEIPIDLGAVTLEDGSATGGVFGVAAATDSSITELTVAKFGHITEIRAVLMETLDGDLDVSLSLHSAAVATDSTAPAPFATVVDLNVVGEDKSEPYDNTASTAGKFLHLEQGASSNNDGQLTQGKLLIYIHGFVTPDDL
tara:strand:+ start:90 stop:647 length:558 start_codon:yes stop_codon:yes gene_type:complete